VRTSKTFSLGARRAMPHIGTPPAEEQSPAIVLGGAPGSDAAAACLGAPSDRRASRRGARCGRGTAPRPGAAGRGIAMSFF
jgi:hypothetical protein